jgi:hypothetical protein
MLRQAPQDYNSTKELELKNLDNDIAGVDINESIYMSKTAGQYEVMELQDYEPLVGSDTIETINNKAEKLQGIHVAHVNSTYYGGGVAELLSSLRLLMNSAGMKTGWSNISIYSTPLKRSTVLRAVTAVEVDKTGAK